MSLWPHALYRCRYIPPFSSASRGAVDFYAAKFQHVPDVQAALMGPAEHRAFNNNQPVEYTTMLPGVFGRNPAVMVLPSEGGSGLAALLSKVGSEDRDGVRYSGLVGFHELGHVYATALNLPAPEGWLNELVAAYFAYGYLREKRPDDAEFWHRASTALYEGLSHSETALDRVHFRVGVENYVWYQASFQIRLDQTFRTHGWAFLENMKRESVTSLGTGPQLLRRLERVAPGFLLWAERQHPGSL